MTPYTTSFLTNLIEKIKEIGNDLVLLKKISWHLGTEIDVDYVIKMLNQSKSEAEKAEKNLLKLKPLESLNCILQWVYRIHCFEKGTTPNLKAFNSFLAGCEKEYMIVYEEKGVNRTKARLKELRLRYPCENNPYEIHRLSPYPFDDVKIRNQGQFSAFIDSIKSITT